MLPHPQSKVQTTSLGYERPIQQWRMIGRWVYYPLLFLVLFGFMLVWLSWFYFTVFALIIISYELMLFNFIFILVLLTLSFSLSYCYNFSLLNTSFIMFKFLVSPISILAQLLSKFIYGILKVSNCFLQYFNICFV